MFAYVVTIWMSVDPVTNVLDSGGYVAQRVFDLLSCYLMQLHNLVHGCFCLPRCLTFHEMYPELLWLLLTGVAAEQVVWRIFARAVAGEYPLW